MVGGAPLVTGQVDNMGQKALVLKLQHCLTVHASFRRALEPEAGLDRVFSHDTPRQAGTC